MTMTGLASLILLGLMECKRALAGSRILFCQNSCKSQRKKANKVDTVLLHVPRNHPLLLENHYVRLVLGLKALFPQIRTGMAVKVSLLDVKLSFVVILHHLYTTDYMHYEID